MKQTYLIPLCLIISFNSFASKQKLGEAIKEQIKSDTITIDGQKKVNVVDDKTQELLREYRLTLRKIESTKLYNQQLEKLIINQKEEKISLAKQIDETKVTNQEIVPLMISMVKTFGDFVKADSPFLPEERNKRVNDLNEMMNRADVTTSEKYRRIMEAYQIENDYGKTLEGYRGTIPKGEKDLTVDFLRVGRVAFIYQTLDNSEAGLWDNNEKKWIILDSDYKNSIKTALKIARKQTAPNIIELPLIKREKSI